MHDLETCSTYIQCTQASKSKGDHISSRSYNKGMTSDEYKGMTKELHLSYYHTLSQPSGWAVHAIAQQGRLLP
jgi:hypothetical protein